MKIKLYISICSIILSISTGFAQEKKFKVHTVAFYNFENLFDTINDPDTYDEEYTPAEGWTLKNYKKKLAQRIFEEAVLKYERVNNTSKKNAL